MNLQQLKDDFSLLDDWEDKYSYIIDLGKSLPAIASEKKDDAHRIEGCVSNVWLDIALDGDGRLAIAADSDAIIVRGFLALILEMFNGLTRSEARRIDVERAFEELGISSHVSANRRSGIAGVAARIMQAAED